MVNQIHTKPSDNHNLHWLWSFLGYLKVFKTAFNKKNNNSKSSTWAAQMRLWIVLIWSSLGIKHFPHGPKACEKFTMKKLLQDLHGKRHTRWDIEVSLSYYRMKNPRLCHSPSPREQGVFSILAVPVWIWSRGSNTASNLSRAARSGATGHPVWPLFETTWRPPTVW